MFEEDNYQLIDYQSQQFEKNTFEIKSSGIIYEQMNQIYFSENDNNEEKYNVDFAKLKETNPDTIAWLKVNGTDIDYPVVKTDNNDYYLIKNMRIS